MDLDLVTIHHLYTQKSRAEMGGDHLISDIPPPEKVHFLAAAQVEKSRWSGPNWTIISLDRVIKGSRSREQIRCQSRLSSKLSESEKFNEKRFSKHDGIEFPRLEDSSLKKLCLIFQPFLHFKETNQLS